jgi:hypothetical protein
MSATRAARTKRDGVRVRCVMCGAMRTIGPGQIAPGDHPLCKACLGPMVPVAAERR